MKKIIESLKDKKKLIVLILPLLIGVILLLFPKGEDEAESTLGADLTTVISYTEKLEDRIRQLCLAVEGVERVSVLVTLESGSEFIYADNVTEESGVDFGKYTSDYLIIDNGSGTSPVLVSEIYPKIRGVAVVCDGGDEPTLQKKLTEMLSAALGISSGRIKIGA